MGLAAAVAEAQFPSACDANMRQSLSGASGQFEHPGTGQDYLVLQDPCWYVACADELTLTFSQFDTEAGYDYVTTYDVVSGASATQLGRHAGTTTPSPITVTGKDGAVVHFHSDNYVTATGFTVSWTCSSVSAPSPFPAACDASLSQSLSGASGQFEHPGTGQNYPVKQDPCWYVACADELTLTFPQFDTEADYDYVTTYEVVNGVPATERGQHSGNTIPSPITVTSGKDGAVVHFLSDDLETATGFTVSWTCGATGPTPPTPPTPPPVGFTFPPACDAAQKIVLTADDAGTLVYPADTEAQYANNENVCWYAACSKQYQTLVWSEFKTESNYDYVTLSSTTGNNPTQVFKQSGSKSKFTSTLTSKDGALIQFTSDTSQTQDGITVRMACSDLNVDYLTTMATRADFEGLAARSTVPGALGVLEVKFVILDINTANPSLYFMNTGLHQYHYDFVSGALGLYTGNSGLGQFNTDSYFFDERKNIAGTMIAHDTYESPTGTTGLYTVEFWPTDPVAAALTIKAYGVIAAAFPAAAGKLYHFPASASQTALYEADKAAFEAAGVAVVLSEALYAGVTFSPLNLGVGFGTLRVIETGSETFSIKDVVVFKHIPNDLSHVGGIITDEPQTPLSHINLKAKQNNMPNAYVRGASTAPDVVALVGKIVKYTVTVDGYSLEEATEAERLAWLASVQPSEPQTPESDLTVTEPARLTTIGMADWVRYGAKASNVAELAKILLPGQVPDGYAIPFTVYDEYMKAKRCEGTDTDPDTMLEVPNGEFRRLCVAPGDDVAAGKTFYEQITAIMQEATFIDDAAERDSKLKDFRKEMKKGEVPADIVAKLNAVHTFWEEADGTMLRSVRLRSSTNNEDLEGFNGAGLYESTTHDPDEGVLAESAKKVWAGLWTFRAFEERDFYRIDHFKTYMGVLAHESYGDEQVNGVGVTKNIFQAGDGHYVNAQYGEISVTNPEPIVVGGETVNSVPDEFLLARVLGNAPDGSIQYQWINQYIRRSNVETVYGLPVPTTNVLEDDEIEELRVAMEKIQAHYKTQLSGGSSFAMDIEFKITRTTDNSRGHLEVKQARPWID